MISFVLLLTRSKLALLLWLEKYKRDLDLITTEMTVHVHSAAVCAMHTYVQVYVYMYVYITMQFAILIHFCNGLMLFSAQMMSMII